MPPFTRSQRSTNMITRPTSSPSPLERARERGERKRGPKQQVAWLYVGDNIFKTTPPSWRKREMGWRESDRMRVRDFAIEIARRRAWASRSFMQQDSREAGPPGHDSLRPTNPGELDQQLNALTARVTASPTHGGDLVYSARCGILVVTELSRVAGPT